MKYVQLTSLFIAVMACTVAINSANARSVFDGPQSVTTQTIGGSCSSAVSFGVEIRDGIVLGYGGECARPRSSQRCRAGERIRGRSVCERQRTGLRPHSAAACGGAEAQPASAPGAGWRSGANPLSGPRVSWRQEGYPLPELAEAGKGGVVPYIRS